jgi:hypothetical protein
MCWPGQSKCLSVHILSHSTWPFNLYQAKRYFSRKIAFLEVWLGQKRRPRQLLVDIEEVDLPSTAKSEWTIALKNVQISSQTDRIDVLAFPTWIAVDRSYHLTRLTTGHSYSWQLRDERQACTAWEFEAQVLQSPVASHADDLPRHEAYRNEGQSNPFQLRMFLGVEGESLLIEFRHMFQICASFL